MLKLFAVLVLMAFAVEEPDPINDEERNDEVAQAQTRARMIACLATARSVLVLNEAGVAAVLEASVHDKEATQQKIVAEIVNKCYKKIDHKVAEELLSKDVVDLEREDLADVVALDAEKFSTSGSSVEWTAEEQTLIDSIKYEMNRTDDGFDQEPPMVEGFDAADYTPAGSDGSTQMLSLGAVGALFAAIGFVVYKKMFTPQQSANQARKENRKQNRNSKKNR